MIVPWAMNSALVLFAVALVYAALSDIVRFRIPNWLCLSIASLFVVYGVFSGLVMGEFALRILAGGGALVVGFALYSLGLFGGGDAKLMAASVPWFRFTEILEYVLLVAVLGGILAVVIILVRKANVPIPSRLASQSWMGRLLAEKSGIPYGVAISLAGLIMLIDLSGPPSVR